MSEKTNIDKVIREKFEDFSVEPPVHMWGEISGELLADKKRKRLAAIRWIAAAAVVVIAFLAGWMINDHSEQVLPSMVEQQKVQKNQQIQTQELPQSQEQQVLAKTETPAEHSTSKPIENQAGTFMPGNVVRIAKAESQETTTNAREIWNFEYLAFKVAEFEKTSGTLKITTTQNDVLPVQVDSQSDIALIAANLQNLEKETKPGHGWILGAHLSPGYSAHTSSYSASYSSNMGANSEGGVRNMGGGLSVQYKTGKKLRIESGVYYAQNSQSMGSSSGLFSMSPEYDYLPDFSNVSGSDRVYANTVELQQGGMAMNSTAGVIKLNQTPQGSELSAENSTDQALNKATLVSSGEFSQQFDFIEIPMYLRYRVVDSKLGVDLMGGVNAGIVVGNNAFISNQYGKQNVGSTEDISSLNVSGTLGLGLSYALGNHFSLSLEPRMNYYLNSINTNPDVSYKPYRFGLFTGVYYAF